MPRTTKLPPDYVSRHPIRSISSVSKLTRTPIMATGTEKLVAGKMKYQKGSFLRLSLA
jgi:hypothetical protein